MMQPGLKHRLWRAGRSPWWGSWAELVSGGAAGLARKLAPSADAWRWLRATAWRAHTAAVGRLAHFFANWVLSTNHKRLAALYFALVLVTGLSGLALATVIRIELSQPGSVILGNNAEKYLTIAALHGIVMVFFMIIPVIFGAFGNFLLPTQLGIRDVAFPRLNSFMYWVTPSGFVLLMHILLFDKSYNLTYWVNYTELRAQLRRRYAAPAEEGVIHHERPETMAAALRSHWVTRDFGTPRATLMERFAPAAEAYPAQASFQGGSLSVVVADFGLPGGAAPQEPSAEDPAAAAEAWAAARPADSWADWRHLKLEREFWRSLDWVTAARRSWLAGKKTYSNLYEPGSVLNKVSAWAPNHLIPGWAFITPYSSRTRYSALGKVDVALVVVFLVSLGSVLSAINYTVTHRYIGAPAMRSRKELRSFFVDALLVGSRMMILANPALLIGILLLLADRHLGTSVFDFSGGGDTILFQHLFWFFGHPEVYIIMIPCFGFMNSLLPLYLRKRLSGRLSLQFSMYTIAFMGFAVWGHHMYMVGLANTVRTLYSTMTVMISVPASTKVLHWCVTLMNSTPVADVGFLFLISFMYFFVLGGLSGMFVAHIGFDVLFHDTFYVIGHFHVMLSGAAMSCVFAAFYFYFPAIWGVRYSRVFGYAHFFFYFVGQIGTLVPMFWLGYAGMPRRVMDYPYVFGGWHSVISSSHLLTLVGVLNFIFMVADSLWEARAPAPRTLGVSRLNTRMAFYVYAGRKREARGTQSLVLAPSTAAAASVRARRLAGAETHNVSYEFGAAV